MNKKLTLGKLAFVLAIIFCLPLIAYLINFAGNGFSGESDKWSNFAGFIGDILSPILNVGNVLVVYYLALEVNAIEERREESNKRLEMERRTNDFRYIAYKEVSSAVFDIVKEIMSTAGAGTNNPIPPILVIQLRYTLSGHSQLFSTLGTLNITTFTDRLNSYHTSSRQEKMLIISDLNGIMSGIIAEIGFT